MFQVVSAGVARGQIRIQSAHAGGAIGAQLLGKGNVHCQVQKRVGIANLDVIIPLQIALGCEHVVVLGMALHYCHQQLFQGFQRF